MSRVFRLEGQVLDEAERPVAAARVWLRVSSRAVTTAADGTFAFDDVPSRRDSVTATKGDLYAWPTLVGPENAGDRLIVHMRVGATLIVHAFADRAPVVGAKLILPDDITAITDTNGTATVRGLPPDVRFGWLAAEGFAYERLIASLEGDPGGVVERFITLHRGSRIEGVVVRPLGQPVPDAMVRLSGKKGELADSYEVGSGVDGTWHVYARPGAYRVAAYSKRHGGTPSLNLECDGRTATSGVKLRIAPAAWVARLVRAATRLAKRGKATGVAGVVVDAHGQPVCGAYVHIADASGTQPWGGHTDSRGRFEANRLATGAYDIFARRSGCTSPLQRVHPGETNIRIVLSDGATVSGRVLLDGNPLPYYGVALTSPDVFGGSPDIGFRAVDGRFTVPNVEPGMWQVAVLGPGTRRKIVDGVKVDSGQHVDVGDIAMERGRRVCGHVQDHAGTPVAGARVIIGHWTRLHFEEMSRLRQWFAGRFETTSDAEGAYVFEGVDAHQGPFATPHIWATHYRAGASVIRELPDSDASIDFVLLGAGTIEGIAEGVRGGRTMAHATRADEPRAARMSFADDEGRFQFEDLPPGDYVVTLDVPDSVQMAPNVTVVDNETARVKFAITDSSVELSVIVPLGRGKDLVLEPISVGAGVGGLVRGIATMGDEDRCSFDYVRPGEYRLSLDGKTWTVAIASSPSKQTIDLHRSGGE